MPDFISAWRFGRSSPSDTVGWVRWETDVDVVRAIIASDTTEEIHYTGDGIPKTTDNATALPTTGGPAASRMLGVPGPSVAMGTPTTLVAGTGIPERRVYVDTFVNDKLQESAPGVSVTVTVNGGTTMTLPTLDPAPAGDHGIDKRRIYVSTDGGPFLFIKEIDATDTSTTDDATRTSTVLQSGGDATKPAWLVPPTNLKGLIGLWNGMIGGFVGKSYMVCEPGKTWAWPVEYQEVLLDDIVGTAKFQQTWVILTNAQPYVVTGTGPLNMGNQAVDFMQACVAKRSILSVGHGVVWASANGLCYLGAGGARLLTESIFSPEQWDALEPTTMHCNRWERYVIVWFDDGSSNKGLMIDPLAPEAGVIFITEAALGSFYDPISDRLYMLCAGNLIKRWHAGDPLQAVWKSQIVRSQVPTTAGYVLIVADEPLEVEFTLWANVVNKEGLRVWSEIYSACISSGDPHALPAGYEANEFQVQIESTGPVQGVFLAEDMDDLP